MALKTCNHLAVLKPHVGIASAQKIIILNYCSIDDHHLRMDCKYALPPESPEPFCKYTNGERLFDTTDPDEEQHAPFRNRAKVRIFPGNICRLLYKNLPNGKSNFTCNIKYANSAMASKTSVVEKSKLVGCFAHSKPIHNIWSPPFSTCMISLIAELLLPCSAWSVLLQSCSGLALTLMTLVPLLDIHWLWTRRQAAAHLNTTTIIIRLTAVGLLNLCVYSQSAISWSECTYTMYSVYRRHANSELTLYSAHAVLLQYSPVLGVDPWQICNKQHECHL